MFFSPELDELKAQIKNVILHESEDFFDEPEDPAVLQVTIRIACEFFDFLKRTDGKPGVSEAEYMADTIRSGLDEFYTMAHWGNILSGLELRKGFSQSLPGTLSEFGGIVWLNFSKATPQQLWRRRFRVASIPHTDDAPFYDGPIPVVFVFLSFRRLFIARKEVLHHGV